MDTWGLNLMDFVWPYGDNCPSIACFMRLTNVTGLLFQTEKADS